MRLFHEICQVLKFKFTRYLDTMLKVKEYETQCLNFLKQL